MPGMMEAVPGGTLFKVFEAVFGANGATNFSGEWHAHGFHGGVESTLAPRTLFYWFDESWNNVPGVPLIGVTGTPVDDDLFSNNRYWKQSIMPQVRAFTYRKWQGGLTSYSHLGRRVGHFPGIKTILVQEEYALA